MAEVDGQVGARIRSFIERIEHVENEVKELNEGKKEVSAEAKADGFDTQVLKEIKARKKSRRRLRTSSRLDERPSKRRGSPPASHAAASAANVSCPTTWPKTSFDYVDPAATQRSACSCAELKQCAVLRIAIGRFTDANEKCRCSSGGWSGTHVWRSRRRSGERFL